MATDKTSASLRYLSLGSIVFGLAGGAFYWWLPLGMIFSLTGLMLGFVDCVSARRRSLDYRLSIVGLVIAGLALVLNIVIAYLGLQIVTFGW